MQKVTMYREFTYADPLQFLWGTDAIPVAVNKVIYEFFGRFDVIIETDVTWFDDGKGELIIIKVTGESQDIVMQAIEEFNEYVLSGKYEKDVKAE